MCQSSINHQPVIKDLWRPWESHSAPTPRCNMCNTIFKRDSELRRHNLSKHQKKHEKCKMCSKKFTRKDNLTRHMKLSHDGQRKPNCQHCNKQLSRQDAVQRHESTCPKNPSKKTDKVHTSFPTHLERLRKKNKNI